MNDRLNRWRSFLFGVAALAALVVGYQSLHAVPAAAARAEAARDLAVADPASVGVSAKRLERLDAGMQAMVDDGKLAGIVTMLARHGKVVFTDKVGRLDAGKDHPVELDSIFRIFSMTKPVVGTALMMLHEEGRWQLDDPVSSFIPEFADLQVYTGVDEDGAMQVEPVER
ncbi:MAG: serine hydrolase, partial [Acidobacteria bacterium]|nr:serine hydrolase [Acidobacteriota bacterium]